MAQLARSRKSAVYAVSTLSREAVRQWRAEVV